MTGAPATSDPLRLSDAARLLGVSAVTLRRWADAGRVDYFRTPGGQRRFLRDDLERIRGDGGDGGPRAPAGWPGAGAPSASITRPKTEHQRMFETLRHASRAITSSVVFEEVLDTIARAAGEALGTSDCVIFSYDPATDMFAARAIYEVVPTGYDVELDDPFPVDGYPGGRKLLERGGMLEEHISDPGLDPASRTSMLAYDESASLAVGLRFGDEPLGMLVMTETAHERHFTKAERELAVALGEQAAIALHNAIMFRRQRQQNARLATLLESSRAVATSLVLDEVLRKVVDATITTFRLDSCVIWEYDAACDALVERCGVDLDTDYQPSGEVWPLKERPTEAAILHGREPVVETISDPNLDPLSRASMEKWGEKTCLSVPLWIGDEARGLLILITSREERHFSEAEIELARALGEQAAIAIDNATLFESAQERGEELAAQAARLDLISDSAYEFSSTLDLHAVILSVAQRLSRVLAEGGCEVFMLSAPNEMTCYASVEGDEVLNDWDGMAYRLDDWGLAKKAATTRRPVTVSDRDDPLLTDLERADMERWGQRSKLVVPLVAGERAIGVVELLERDRSRVFTADEIATVEAVCRVAALAIDNAQLYEAQEERNRHLVSLLDVGTTLTSTVDVQEVLAIVARQTAEALGCPECIIFEFDEEADTLTARAYHSVAPSDYNELGLPLQLAEHPDDRAVLTGGTIVIESVSDPATSQSARESLLAYGEKTCMSIPLHFGDEKLGIMVLVELEAERVFTPSEVELARGLGEQASAALHNARQFARLTLRTRETELLNEIARKATASLNVVEVARVTVEEIKRLMRFDRASLVLADHDGILGAVFATDDQVAMLDGLALAECDTVLLSMLGDERVGVLSLPDDAALLGGHASLEGLESAALVGLLRDDAVVGVLALGNAGEKAFTRTDRRFLEDLGAHLSLAMNNASLFENVKVMHLGNLRALSSALNAKDYYTLGHTARVAAYAVLLAKELGWSQELVDQIEEIAYLHDIGKIAISDRSLLKPGPLSDEEWELMREHPVISAEIIESLLGEHLVAGVRHHHEHYDGSGYPDGLSGEGISPIARLLCVVDSYDAMSSLRLYRQALTYRQCLCELENGKGAQFDPAMVDAFVCALEGLRELKGQAQVAAWEAAVEIDATKHAGLSGTTARERPDYAEVEAVLREAAGRCPTIMAMSTEVRIDEHRSMFVVASSDDPQRAERVGEILLSDQEEMEAYAGRPMDANVLFVDERGAWVCGLAPICADDGEIVGLVRAEVPATDVSGPLGKTSNVRQTFAGLARDAASRLMRVEIDSMIDGLSGLYNHRYLHERLSEEVSRAMAQGTELTLLFCDVDNFKEINDRLGHRVGDDVLRRISQLIAKTIRRIDLAARYGGHEFAVVLIESTAEQALEVAERIRAIVAETPLVPDGETPTVSVGLATVPGDATTKTELLDKADWAMYLAKRRGRNRCVRFSDG